MSAAIRRWQVALGVSLLLAAHAAEARDSAIQCVPDRRDILVNKDVGTQRWVINYRISDGYTTGNVFDEDGTATFVGCTRSAVSNGQMTFNCSTASPCSLESCPQWQPIADPVQLACGFFASPCRKNPTTLDHSATCSGTPPRPPYDSEESCQAFATASGCYEYQYEPSSCTVSYCCSQPSCVVGEEVQGWDVPESVASTR